MTSAASDAATPILAALSLLRSGRDTHTQRVFRKTLWPEIESGRETIGSDTLTRVADLLGIENATRSRRLATARAGAEGALARAAALEITPLTILEPSYPAWLREIVDPPLVLWTQGDLHVLARPAVAVVGSRSATTVGLEISRQLAAGLAEAGLVVVSGLARGIDAAAHRGSLEAGGLTVAVLGCGVDVSYPRQHRSLAVEVRTSGLLLSEFPPGTLPYASHFPLRNRIISGLSRATIIVEASNRSGSLITARMAMEQGRSVLAVPGNALSGTYRGCHGLIKDGATLVETVDDVLVEIGWPPRRNAGPGPASKSLDTSSLCAEMPPGQPVSVDELASRSGRPVAAWLAELASLELAGKVARTAAGLFVRLDGPATNRDR